MTANGLGGGRNYAFDSSCHCADRGRCAALAGKSLYSNAGDDKIDSERGSGYLRGVVAFKRIRRADLFASPASRLVTEFRAELAVPVRARM